MIKLTINGQTLQVPENYTVLLAAESAGIIIPTICYHKDLSPFGGCRMCVVEVQGSRLPMTSCNLPVSAGMVVQTDSPELTRYRRVVLQLMLSNYYDAAYKKYNGKFDFEQDSELAQWARFYQIDVRSSMAVKPEYPVDSDPNPFVWVDMNKCIQCTRCVRACAEIQGRFVWSQSFRGYKSRIVAGADTTMLQARCESCGACVAYCPTGALDNKMSVNAGRADRLVRTTCSYCGIGCQLDLNVKDDAPGGRVFRVTSCKDSSKPSVNGSHLCVKGRYGYEFIHSIHRHTKPRVRQYLLDNAPRPKGRGKWVDVDWDTALQVAAKQLKQVRDQNGGEFIGVLASGKCLNEECYLLNKFARQVLQTNNIDCTSNIYSSSVVEGLVESLGLPAVSNSFDDLGGNARSLLVIGCNLTEQHPVLGARIRQAVLRRKVKMVVANPDFINIAEYAALPLYYLPNTETSLINGLMNIILEKGWEEKEAINKHTKEFENFKSVIDQYTPKRVSETTGLSIDSLYKAAEILALNKPTAVIWGVGVADPNTGIGNIHSLANLKLLLGDLEIPGGGMYPLQSHNNLQGACDMGNLPEMLPGYQAITDQVARHKFEDEWGTIIPSKPGLKASEILKSIAEDRIKALYILGEDILNTSPEAARIRQGLENCDFIVLQEVLSSETTRYADVLLPAVSFSEKNGTFTSAERRIQMVNQAIQVIGEARADWEIIADLAQRILSTKGNRPDQPVFSSWIYADTAQIMEEIAVLTPIYSGVSHSRLLNDEVLIWPVFSRDQPGLAHLSTGAFSSGVTHWIPAEQCKTLASEQKISEVKSSKVKAASG